MLYFVVFNTVNEVIMKLLQWNYQNKQQVSYPEAGLQKKLNLNKDEEREELTFMDELQVEGL